MKTNRERKYHRFTWTDRLKLEALYNAGNSYRFTAAQLGFAPSAIHNEVKHGLYDHLDGATWLTIRRYGYRHWQGQGQKTGDASPHREKNPL